MKSFQRSFSTAMLLVCGPSLLAATVEPAYILSIISTERDVVLWHCQDGRSKFGNNPWKSFERAETVYEFGEGWGRQFHTSRGPMVTDEFTWKVNNDMSIRAQFVTDRPDVKSYGIVLTPIDEDSFELQQTLIVDWGYGLKTKKVHYDKCVRTNPEILFSEEKAGFWTQFRVPHIVKHRQKKYEEMVERRVGISTLKENPIYGNKLSAPK